MPHQNRRNQNNVVSKTIILLRLPGRLLITVCNSFIRPHLDYSDFIYDQVYNTSFHGKLESLQYVAAVAITAAIRGTSKEKLYQELGFESLQQRRWYRKHCYFCEIFKEQSPNFTFSELYTTRARGVQCETQKAFLSIEIIINISKLFFPATIKEWNMLYFDIRNSESHNVFKSKVLKFSRLKASFFFYYLNPKGVKLVTRSQLGLSHFF